MKAISSESTEYFFCCQHLWIFHEMSEQDSTHYVGTIQLKYNKDKRGFQIDKLSFVNSTVDDWPVSQIWFAALFVDKWLRNTSFGFKVDIVLPNG